MTPTRETFSHYSTASDLKNILRIRVSVCIQYSQVGCFTTDFRSRKLAILILAGDLDMFFPQTEKKRIVH